MMFNDPHLEERIQSQGRPTGPSTLVLKENRLLSSSSLDLMTVKGQTTQSLIEKLNKIEYIWLPLFTLLASAQTYHLKEFLTIPYSAGSDKPIHSNEIHSS